MKAPAMAIRTGDEFKGAPVVIAHLARSPVLATTWKTASELSASAKRRVAAGRGSVA
jgi:hypothetical protein